jgi:dihydrofolate reductase
MSSRTDSPLTYYVACSLDGFIAHTDGSHDGFFQDDPYLSEIFARFPDTCPGHLRAALGLADVENQWFDAVLMGRKTYDIGFQLGVTNPYPHLKQYLFSRSLAASPDAHVELVSNDAAGRVKRLKAETEKGIWLCGGAELATELFAQKLIDRLILKVNPFLMGAGIPVFAGVVPQTALDLTQSHTYSNGVIQLQYQVRL